MHKVKICINYLEFFYTIFCFCGSCVIFGVLLICNKYENLLCTLLYVVSVLCAWCASDGYEPSQSYCFSISKTFLLKR